MTATSYSNILSNVWNSVYALLNVRTNVADPCSGSADVRKFIYSREPDVKAADFQGFPYIILHPATLNSSVGNQRLNMNARKVAWGFEIEIVTCDRERNNRTARGMTDSDAICEDVFQTLNDLSNRKTLQAAGLFSFTLDASMVVAEDFSNTLVYRRSVIVGCSTHMKVSA